MNRAVLMVFGHNEIFQAVAAHTIIKPLAQLFNDGRIIVAVALLGSRVIVAKRSKRLQAARS